MHNQVEVKPRNAAKRQATLAIMALLSCPFICIIILKAGQRSSMPNVMSVIGGVLFLAICLGGMVASILALAAIRTHGRKGLLWRGVVGLGLSVFLLTTFVQGFLGGYYKVIDASRPLTRERAMQMPQVISDSTIHYDPIGKYRFEIPAGFEPNPSTMLVAHSFTVKPTDGHYRMFWIEHLGFLIDDPLDTRQGVIDLKSVYPSETEMGVHETVWNSRRVGVISARFPINDNAMTYFLNVRLPTKPQAVQITLAGPAEDKQALHALMDQLLEGFKAASNVRPNAGQ